jgi:hypothetical protein
MINHTSGEANAGTNRQQRNRRTRLKRDDNSEGRGGGLVRAGEAG